MNLTSPKTITIILIIITVILAIYLFIQFQNKNNNTIKIKINQQTFILEIADNPISRSKGLSNRDSLCSTCGMIFVYNKESIYPFWMKDTRIPLDILWLDSNGLVVDILPGQPQSLNLLKNSTPAQYIIELNQNTTAITIGDKINIPNEIIP